MNKFCGSKTEHSVVLYAWKLQWKETLNVLPQKISGDYVTEVLANAMVVIISQYHIYILYTVTYTMLYVNFISVKLGKGEKIW